MVQGCVAHNKEYLTAPSGTIWNRKRMNMTMLGQLKGSILQFCNQPKSCEPPKHQVAFPLYKQSEAKNTHHVCKYACHTNSHEYIIEYKAYIKPRYIQYPLCSDIQ